MSTLFPSMPSYGPASPEEDRIPHVTITAHGIELDFGDQTMHIPAGAISKGSVVIKPGSDNEVNVVQLEILASNVWMDDGIRGEIRVYP